MIKNLILFIFLFNSSLLLANDSTYVNRQTAYIDTTLQSNKGDKLTLQA